MNKRFGSINKNKAYISLLGFFPLACIFFAEWVKMHFLEVIRGISDHQHYVTYSVYLSVFAYPLLAYFSDIWCRKKMLLITMILLLLSIILMYFNSYFLSMVFFSISPVTAISQAAYCDVHITNAKEPNIINTFIVQSLPWLIIPIISYKLSISSFAILAIGGVLLLIIFFFSKDARDKELKKYSFGILEAFNKYGIKTCIIIIIAFFLANWAWSMFFYRLEERLPFSIISKYFLLAPGLAFFLGAIFARMIIQRDKILFFHYSKNKKSINADNQFKLLIIIFLGLIPFFIFINLISIIMNISTKDSFMQILPELTLLGGFIIPLIYSFFSSRLGYHSLGLVFAILEIVGSLSESVGAWFETFNILSNYYYLGFLALFITIISTLLLRLLAKKNIEI